MIREHRTALLAHILETVLGTSKEKNRLFVLTRAGTLQSVHRMAITREVKFPSLSNRGIFRPSRSARVAAPIRWHGHIIKTSPRLLVDGIIPGHVCNEQSAATWVMPADRPPARRGRPSALRHTRDQTVSSNRPAHVAKRKLGRVSSHKKVHQPHVDVSGDDRPALDGYLPTPEPCSLGKAVAVCGKQLGMGHRSVGYSNCAHRFRAATDWFLDLSKSTKRRQRDRGAHRCRVNRQHLKPPRALKLSALSVARKGGHSHHVIENAGARIVSSLDVGEPIAIIVHRRRTPIP